MASFIKKETAIINRNHSDSRNHASNKPIKMESNITTRNTIREICTSAFPIWESLQLQFETMELGQLLQYIYAGFSHYFLVMVHRGF